MRLANTRVAAVLISLVLTFARVSNADLIAFSLVQAQSEVSSPAGADKLVKTIGGITQIAGMVYDQKNADIIIVGARSKNEEPVSLDDLIVAMRARLVDKKWPRVSIDSTPDTTTTGKQRVNFVGGIENTAFGKTLLDSDILLKKMALGQQPAKIWGVTSYFDRSIEALKAGKRDDVRVRFWFFPIHPRLYDKDNAFSVEDATIGVETEMMNAIIDGKPAVDIKNIKDDVSESFKSDVTQAFEDLSIAMPPLRRLKQLFGVVAVAEGISSIQAPPDLAFLLNKYDVAIVHTDDSVPVLTQEGSGVRLSGGVELKVLRLGSEDHNVSSMRDAVLKSRPDPKTICWSVPLDNWRIAGYDVATQSSTTQDPLPSAPIGCDIARQVSTTSDVLRNWNQITGRTTTDIPQITRYSDIPKPLSTPKIGGVMLSGTAKLAGGGSGEVDLSSGGFSLVVEGQNARLDPRDFDRFVTALWAVYYCKQVPGISIDPIDPKINKHFVRYIGQVVNSDLGRVMREADYQMKKWAVGTDRPDIPGFQNPDDWAEIHGNDLYNTYRRFWFIPDDFTFREGNGLLLLQSGNMRLKTELMIDGVRGQTTPEDEGFANFITAHYEQISAKYPIYSELFEYAKMVALSRYLKEQGVPLQWFLMANRDHILTENSPGTVLELAKKSDHFEGVEIKGGVNMDAQSHYVYDAPAMKAIAQLMSNRREDASGLQFPEISRTLPSATPTASTSNISYSAVPQKSLTSGRDDRGLRYQTDVAFRMGTEPALELVRYFDRQHLDRGMFGNGWELLLPYSALPGKESRAVSIGGKSFRVPAYITLRNLLSGVDERLEYDEKRYQSMGYVPVPTTQDSSTTVGLFVTQAGFAGVADELSIPASRLADKLGNEFWFDERGLLTTMILGEEHILSYEYARKQTRTIVRPTVNLIREGDETVIGPGGVMPKRLGLTDLSGNQGMILSIGKDGRYYPESGANPHVSFVTIAPNGKYVLVDDEDNNVYFQEDGVVESIDFSSRTHVVQNMKYERVEVEKDEMANPTRVKKPGQEVSFEYLVDLTGMLRVGKARMICPDPRDNFVLKYEYDSSGNLIRVLRAKS